MNNQYFENIIFFYLLKHPELILSYKGVYFQNQVMHNLFEVVKEFMMDYREEPTEVQVIEIVKLHNKENEIPIEAIHTIWENKDCISQYSDEWLTNNTKSYGEWQSFMDGLKKVIAYVKTILSDVTFENVEESVRKAKEIFNTASNFKMNISKGHDFFDPANHCQTQLETRTTGYNFIDQCLKGGWANKTFNVFMGSPKVGKSMWLCNLCANSVMNGENSAYITLEMSYQLVSQRIGSNMFNIEIEKYEEFARDQDLMTKKMKSFFDGLLTPPGTFIIEEFPTSSATVYDIEAFLIKKEEEMSTESKPFKFKNVFIDYVNIMKDAKNPNSENMYVKIKSICEDVRAMAQRNNWCIISLTQTNRTAYDSSDIAMQNVSESGGLIATVDSLFGIIQSPTMRVENKYYIKAVAIRNSGHMGDKKGYIFNPSYLRITEDATEGIITENQSLEKGPAKAENNGQTPYRNILQTQMRPVAPETYQNPQLGLTETELNANSLFSL